MFFRRGTTWKFIFIIIILGKEPDGIKMGEQSQKQEIRCQGNKGQFREVTLCFQGEATHWDFITTESFEIHPSLDSTKHIVFKGNLCSNSPLTGKSFWVHSTLSLSFIKENYRENGFTPRGPTSSYLTSSV